MYKKPECIKDVISILRGNVTSAAVKPYFPKIELSMQVNTDIIKFLENADKYMNQLYLQEIINGELKEMFSKMNTMRDVS